MIVEEFIFIQ